MLIFFFNLKFLILMVKRNVMNRDLYKSFEPEKGSKVKLVVPQQNMSIKAIYERFSKGRPTVGKANEGFDQEIQDTDLPENLEDMEQLSRLEPFERRQKLSDIARIHESMKGEADAMEKARRKQKADADAEYDEIRKEHKARKDSNSKGDGTSPDVKGSSLPA